MGDQELGTASKKVMFYDTDKRHADLKIRLQHDSLTQSAFFRAMITGYLEKDPRIVEYIEDYKEDNDIQNKVDRRKTSRLIKAGNEMEKAHGLKEEEIDNIFDMIEQEHPEL
tara:strand:+ start:1129 stop:1464 length:336 start_codon:yes stop_codon:yes gene_type:complete